MTQEQTARPDSMELFNPFADGFIDDPYSTYHKLRAYEPLHFHTGMNMWLMTRYRDIDEMLRTNDLGRGEQMRFFGNFEAGSAIDLVSRSWLFGMDPPDHTRVRRLFAKAFTPRRIARLRPYIEAKVDELLDQFAADGGGDFIEKVAQLLPVAVICHLLGIPDADHAVCKQHSSAVVPLLDPVITEEQLEKAEAGSAWFLEYFDHHIESRRRDPQDDLVSALLAATEDGQKLAKHELMNNVIFLFGAGHETTTSTLGNGLAALLLNPEQYDLLRKDLSLLSNAVLEMLRWDSPVQYIGRRVMVDNLVVDGVELERDQVVMGLLGAGNRDPEQFADPDRFDITRPEIQPLSFGAGIHYCLGAALSRLETEIVFEKLITRFPRLSMDGVPPRKGLFAVRSYTELVLEV